MTARRRIAIVGSGIAGLVAAHRLHRSHDITLFEAGEHVGGHTHTVDVDDGGKLLAVDTGFIVFNDWTYPSFIALLDELRVASQPSNMSFSLRCERTGLEYNGTSLDSLFAQRRNLFSPAFLRMLLDILRFNARSKRLLATLDPHITLGEYLAGHGYSRRFLEHYVVPMGRAIWSASAPAMLAFPARFFVEFFARHGFLNVDDRPQWRSIRGGSREYVRAITAPFLNRIRLRMPVTGVQRQPHQVVLRTARGHVESFDHVVLACHSDQALALLADPTPAERDVLSALPFQKNEVVLHTDASLLPRAPRARAAWNYHVLAEPQAEVAITYCMNTLQNLATSHRYLVTLNGSAAIDPKRVLRRIQCSHPIYTPQGVAAQARRTEINGARRTYFCGAYWSYGFHEDGVKSALWALDDFDRTLNREQELARAG